MVTGKSDCVTLSIIKLEGGNNTAETRGGETMGQKKLIWLRVKKAFLKNRMKISIKMKRILKKSRWVKEKRNGRYCTSFSHRNPGPKGKEMGGRTKKS